MSAAEKVRIVWSGQGGELDSVVVKNDSEHALANAIIKLVRGNIVTPGDSITVEVEAK
jgi:hypothetical protein